jgi:diguanylate cyclase (GGDEF)-like protein
MFSYLASFALARFADEPGELVVVKVDLDRFHAVNETLGHEVGDDVLRCVAERLQAGVSDRGVVARFAADEFLVLLERPGASGSLDGFADEVLAVLHEPIAAAGSPVFVTASLGAVVATSSDSDLSVLIANAGIAAAVAKRRGGGRLELFRDSFRPPIIGRGHTESSLHLALARGEFEVHYQPVLSLTDRRLVGVEALIRWAHPTHGLVLPSHFIGAAEDTGLIVPIGAWMLGEACRAYQRWATLAYERAGAPIVDVMEVNLSARQLADPKIIETVREVLVETGIEPGRLMLEITESALMSDPEDALLVLRRLKNLGVRLAIDDFGTGFSSLSYLRKFPLDALKIDKSFVEDLTTSPEDAVIVASVVNLAHALGLEVVAEGVEDENQLAALEATGCDLFQGFLYSPALEISEFEERVAADSSN